MRDARRHVAPMLFAASLFGCGRSLVGAPCPCVEGFTCCPGQNACYVAGQCPGGQAGSGATSSGIAGSGAGKGSAGNGGSAGSSAEESTEDAFVFPEFCTTDGWCGARVDYSAVWGSAPNDIWLAAHSIPDNGTRSALLHFDGRAFSNYDLEPVLNGASGSLAVVLDIEAFWGFAANDLWAAGALGVLHWDGQSWTVPVSSSCSCPAATGEAIWGAAPDDLWVAGGAAFSHFDGSTWTTVPGPELYTIKSFWGSGTADIWGVGAGGKMAHYDGASWSSYADAFGGTPATTELRAIWGSASNDIWVAGMNSTLLHWDGVSWENRGSALPGIAPGEPRDLAGIWGSAADNVWVAATDGSLLHFDGAGWFKAPQPTANALRAVWGDDRGGLVAVGASGNVLRFGGNQWRTAPPHVVSSDLMTLWGASGDELLALGGGQSAVWDGSSWHATNTAPYALPGSRLAGTSAADVWAVNVSSSAPLVHFNGARWSPVNLNATPADTLPTGPLTDVWTSAPDDVWAVGPATTETRGLLVHWDGSAWSASDPGVDVNLTSIWGTARDDVWVTTSSETVLRFDGASWTPLVLSATGTSPSNTNWHLVRGTGPSDVWLFGGYGWSGYKAGGFAPRFRHWDGTSWSESIAFGSGSGGAGAVWTPEPGAVWLLMGGQLLRFSADTGEFVPEHVGPVGGNEPVTLQGIGGTETQVFAVGSKGTILHKAYASTVAP